MIRYLPKNVEIKSLRFFQHALCSLQKESNRVKFVVGTAFPLDYSVLSTVSYLQKWGQNRLENDIYNVRSVILTSLVIRVSPTGLCYFLDVGRQLYIHCVSSPVQVSGKLKGLYLHNKLIVQSILILLKQSINKELVY